MKCTCFGKLTLSKFTTVVLSFFHQLVVLWYILNTSTGLLTRFRTWRTTFNVTVTGAWTWAASSYRSVYYIIDHWRTLTHFWGDPSLLWHLLFNCLPGNLNARLLLSSGCPNMSLAQLRTHFVSFQIWPFALLSLWLCWYVCLEVKGRRNDETKPFFVFFHAKLKASLNDFLGKLAEWVIKICKGHSAEEKSNIPRTLNCQTVQT